MSLVAWGAQEAVVSSARAATREARARLPVLSPGETRWEQGGARTPNLRFEFLATWPGAILAAGSQRVPLYAPRPGWGKGSLSRRDAVAKLPIWGLTCGYFRGLWISSGLKKSKLASMLVVWSPRGPRVHDVGRMRRRGRVPGGLPDAARNATGATFAGH